MLLDQFGERESSSNLMEKLKLTRGGTTIENFHYRVTDFVNRLHNRILSHGDGTFSGEEVKRIALRVFKEGLTEPTRTLIFGRNPMNFVAKHLCCFPVEKLAELNEINYTCKFVEREFSAAYDGLIGNNILRNLECVIDMNRKMFKTKSNEDLF